VILSKLTRSKTYIIIGGGLAGLTAALHLSRSGLDVTLIEKQEYPKHKVCGEYISNEVLAYLNSLGIEPLTQNAKQITQFKFSDDSGHTLDIELPGGGFGMSRYAFDKLLLDKALSMGVKLIKATVYEVLFEKDQFSVTTVNEQRYQADYVIGAYGKRSNLDKKLSRNFIRKQSPWLGVKAHYKGDFPEDTVALHNFNGGYCGLSKVETGHINACYLADFRSFKRYRNLEDYQKEVLEKNKALASFFASSEMVFEKPLTISQISFEKKEPVENHILMIGDSAGLIHPLCGNGMAMAIHSAKIISELLINNIENDQNRSTLEQSYSKLWKVVFSKRLYAGRLLQYTLQHKQLTKYGVRFVRRSPWLLKTLIRATHGSTI